MEMIKGYSHKPMGTVALAELMNSGIITREEVLYHLRQDYYMEIFQQSFHQ